MNLNPAANQNPMSRSANTSYASADKGPASAASAVSWAAIFAGAVAAAALALILLILGLGLGMTAVSPWAFRGVSAGTFGIAAIAWMTVTQILAAGLGGYLAGRLRTKWVSVHTDEVYFRDTAHGFLAWAVAALITAGALATATGAIVNSGVQAGAAIAGTAVTGAVSAGAAAASGGDNAGMSASDAGSYFIDSLFRKDTAPASATSGATSGTPAASANLDATSANSAADSAAGSAASSAAEVSRIFINSLRAGTLPPEDVRYVGKIVAQRTALSQQDAEKRVTATFTRMQTKLREAETAARETADKTRKASAYAALWIFVSLLTGAFAASLAATFGGRQRDFQHPSTL